MVQRKVYATESQTSLCKLTLSRPQIRNSRPADTTCFMRGSIPYKIGTTACAAEFLHGQACEDAGYVMSLAPTHRRWRSANSDCTLDAHSLCLRLRGRPYPDIENQF